MFKTCLGLVAWISTLKYASWAINWNLEYLIKRQNSSFVSVSVTMWFLIGGSIWYSSQNITYRNLFAWIFNDTCIRGFWALPKWLNRSVFPTTAFKNLSHNFKMVCLTFTFSVCHSRIPASTCFRTAMLRWWKPNEILTDQIHLKYKYLSNSNISQIQIHLK